MKKFLSLLLVCVTVASCFCSCSGSAKVKVNGVKIDNEVYYYFKDLHDSNEGLMEESLSEYVTINSEFKNRNLKLTSAQKADLSVLVDDLWHLYGLHYEKLGISKQTIYKIETSKLYEDVLLDYYYGQGGVEPVSEKELKAYFEKNYIAIRFVTGYLFNVDENGMKVAMTDKEKAAVINELAKAVDLINTGSDIEAATTHEIHDGLINSSYDGSFPSGFYKEVEQIEKGKAATVSLDDYVFLVERVDVFDETFNYYERYRTRCLRDMKGEDFDELVDKWSQDYVVK